jgi:hypothetical protein
LRIAGMIMNNLCSFWRSSCTHDIVQRSRRLSMKHPWPCLVSCASLRSFITCASSTRTSANSATRCYNGGRRAHQPMALRIRRSWQVPFVSGLRQVRIQGLALGSPSSGHSVHRHQYGNMWALILLISVDSHRKAQPLQARQGQEIEHHPLGRPQKECNRAAESRSEREYAWTHHRGQGTQDCGCCWRRD